MDKETLYELRTMIATHPYYQTARLLMLQNLYLLHDPTFDEELRRAAIYITDRSMLFQLVEAAHYQLQPHTQPEQKDNVISIKTTNDRTSTLIDNFLRNIPEDTQESKRKPTAADATIDYVAYLIEQEEQQAEPAPAMKGQGLIDDFIDIEKGTFQLKDDIEFTPVPTETVVEEEEENGYFTETLARIYIKQGRYSKALEIIQRLNLDYPKKNRYFADQIRFLEKLIQNSNKK